MDDHRAPLIPAGSTSETGLLRGQGDGSSGGLVEKAGTSPNPPHRDYNPLTIKPQLRPINTSGSKLTARQINTIMEKLTLEEFRAKLFDEIVQKVKTELTETSRGDSESETVCEEARSTAQSSGSVSPKTQLDKPYQATVEDADTDFEDDSSCDEGDVTPDSLFAASPTSPTVGSPLQTPASSVRSESISSMASIGPAYPPQAALQTDSRPSALRSGNMTEQKAKPNVRWSDRRPVILHNRLSEGPPSPVLPRPAMPQRTSTDSGLSAVDLKWGQLFDSNGEPTRRFEEVLRGLATYLIAEFSPTDSIVITPEKLCLFYDMYMLEPETIPFHHIFNCSSKQEFKDLEYLYRELRCEYHLVQDHTIGRPYIPGLTVHGFRDWMTLLVRSYPDREVKRLSKIFEDLPIEADGFALNGERERLPKQLSRHLFPATRHEKIYRFISSTFDDWKKMTGYKEPSSPMSSPSFHKASVQSPDPIRISDDYKGFVSIHKNETMNGYHDGPQRTQIARASSYTKGYTHAEPASEHQTYVTREKRGRQDLGLSPPPIGIHHQRKGSPHEPYHRYSATGQGGRPESSYWATRAATDDDKVLVQLVAGSNAAGTRPGGRRSREDEYRLLQGRDPRTSLDISRGVPRGS